jgi:glutathione S-transferase
MEDGEAITNLELDHIVSAFGDYPYALKRYVNETRRLYRTMDKALAKNPSGYLVGDHLTIADIAIWPWTTAYSRSFHPPKEMLEGISMQMGLN